MEELEIPMWRMQDVIKSVPLADEMCQNIYTRNTDRQKSKKHIWTDMILGKCYTLSLMCNNLSGFRIY